MTRDSPASRPSPQGGGGGYGGGSRGRPLARERVTAPPSSLPSGGLLSGFGRSRGRGSGSGSTRESGSPERTKKAPVSKRMGSPERTGEVASSDDDVGGAGGVAEKGREPGGAEACGGGEARLKLEVSVGGGASTWSRRWLRCWGSDDGVGRDRWVSRAKALLARVVPAYPELCIMRSSRFFGGTDVP